MPLRCVDSQDNSVQSHLLDVAQWAELKRIHGMQKHLRMPCCQQRVVLKTSKLGTNFFAHQRRGECTTKPESAEHLMLKSLVATTIEQCGWSVETEVRGQTDQSEDWIADVFATRGRAQIAVEIQWSRQMDADTYARQARYQRSGVRGLWLFKQADFPVDAAVPAMRVTQDENGQFGVTVSSCESVIEDGFTHQVSAPIRLSVPDFIRHAFNGDLWFGLYRENSTITATFCGAFVKCWKCGGWTNVVAKVQISSADIHHVLNIPLHELQDMPFLMAQLPLSSGVRDRKIGKITKRYSKTEGGDYLANGCVNCNALQGKFFLQDVYHRLKPVYSKTLIVSREFQQFLCEYASYMSCWRVHQPVNRN